MITQIVLGNMTDYIEFMDDGTDRFIEIGENQKIDDRMIEWRMTANDGFVKPNLYVYSLIGLVEGLLYIHGKKIIHRDIKLDNILFTRCGTWKICDFGISKIHQVTNTPYQPISSHVAPEQIGSLESGTGQKYSYQIDVYAMGLVFYQIFNHSNIKQSAKELDDAKNEFLRYDNSRILKAPEHQRYFPGWKDLVIGMLDKNPNKRYSVGDVKAELDKMNQTIKDRESEERRDPDTVWSKPDLYADVLWFDSEIARKYKYS